MEVQTSAKPSAWGAKKSTPVKAVSLASIQSEEQSVVDARSATRLEDAEFDGLEAALRASLMDAQKISEEERIIAEAIAASLCEPVAPRDDSEEAAIAAIAASEAAAASAAADVAASAEVTMSDAMLAAMLQAEFNQEVRDNLAIREKRANDCAPGKVSVTLSLHREQMLVPTEFDVGEEEDDEDYDEDYSGERVTSNDFTPSAPRTRKLPNGSFVTKHNLAANGRRNLMKMENEFPLSFPSGDLSGRGDLRISNPIFNSLKGFAERSEGRRARLGEKKDHSTADMALDSKTRISLYRLVNNGFISEVDGIVSTGKESVILHGRAHTTADPDSPIEDCAIKVFKTTLTEFKQRQQFLHGDRRFDARVGQQVARKLVKLWAEKEMANLSRMTTHGLRCPRVFHRKDHILVMSFIGSGVYPAPKLKDVQLSSEELDKCFLQVQDGMRVMYQRCSLVHADLSEYNLLYHEGEPWFIDVGQSVDPMHPRAPEFLYRDCCNVHRFFTDRGAEVPSAADIFRYVSDLDISEEAEIEFKTHLHSSAKSKASAAEVAEDDENTSSVCVTFPRVRDLDRGALHRGYAPADGEEDDDDDDEDEVDEDEDDEEEEDVEDEEEVERKE